MTHSSAEILPCGKIENSLPTIIGMVPVIRKCFLQMEEVEELRKLGQYEYFGERLTMPQGRVANAHTLEVRYRSYTYISHSWS